MAIAAGTAVNQTCEITLSPPFPFADIAQNSLHGASVGLLLFFQFSSDKNAHVVRPMPGLDTLWFTVILLRRGLKCGGASITPRIFLDKHFLTMHLYP